MLCTEIVVVDGDDVVVVIVWRNRLANTIDWQTQYLPHAHH